MKPPKSAPSSSIFEDQYLASHGHDSRLYAQIEPKERHVQQRPPSQAKQANKALSSVVLKSKSNAFVLLQGDKHAQGVLKPLEKGRIGYGSGELRFDGVLSKSDAWDTYRAGFAYACAEDVVSKRHCAVLYFGDVESLWRAGNEHSRSFITLTVSRIARLLHDRLSSAERQNVRVFLSAFEIQEAVEDKLIDLSTGTTIGTQSHRNVYVTPTGLVSHALSSSAHVKSCLELFREHAASGPHHRVFVVSVQHPDGAVSSLEICSVGAGESVEGLEEMLADVHEMYLSGWADLQAARELPPLRGPWARRCLAYIAREWFVCAITRTVAIAVTNAENVRPVLLAEQCRVGRGAHVAVRSPLVRPPRIVKPETASHRTQIGSPSLQHRSYALPETHKETKKSRVTHEHRLMHELGLDATNSTDTITISRDEFHAILKREGTTLIQKVYARAKKFAGRYQALVNRCETLEEENASLRGALDSIDIGIITRGVLNDPEVAGDLVENRKFDNTVERVAKEVDRRFTAERDQFKARPVADRPSGDVWGDAAAEIFGALQGIPETGGGGSGGARSSYSPSASVDEPAADDAYRTAPKREREPEEEGAGPSQTLQERRSQRKRGETETHHESRRSTYVVEEKSVRREESMRSEEVSASRTHSYEATATASDSYERLSAADSESHIEKASATERVSATDEARALSAQIMADVMNATDAVVPPTPRSATAADRAGKPSSPSSAPSGDEGAGDAAGNAESGVNDVAVSSELSTGEKSGSSSPTGEKGERVDGDEAEDEVADEDAIGQIGSEGNLLRDFESFMQNLGIRGAEGKPADKPATASDAGDDARGDASPESARPPSTTDVDDAFNAKTSVDEVATPAPIADRDQDRAMVEATPLTSSLQQIDRMQVNLLQEFEQLMRGETPGERSGDEEAEGTDGEDASSPSEALSGLVASLAADDDEDEGGFDLDGDVRAAVELQRTIERLEADLEAATATGEELGAECETLRAALEEAEKRAARTEEELVETLERLGAADERDMQVRANLERMGLNADLLADHLDGRGDISSISDMKKRFLAQRRVVTELLQLLEQSRAQVDEALLAPHLGAARALEERVEVRLSTIDSLRGNVAELRNRLSDIVGDLKARDGVQGEADTAAPAAAWHDGGEYRIAANAVSQVQQLTGRYSSEVLVTLRDEIQALAAAVESQTVLHDEMDGLWSMLESVAEEAFEHRLVLEGFHSTSALLQSRKELLQDVEYLCDSASTLLEENSLLRGGAPLHLRQGAGDTNSLVAAAVGIGEASTALSADEITKLLRRHAPTSRAIAHIPHAALAAHCMAQDDLIVSLHKQSGDVRDELLRSRRLCERERARVCALQTALRTGRSAAANLADRDEPTDPAERIAALATAHSTAEEDLQCAQIQARVNRAMVLLLQRVHARTGATSESPIIELPSGPMSAPVAADRADAENGEGGASGEHAAHSTQSSSVSSGLSEAFGDVAQKDDNDRIDAHPVRQVPDSPIDEHRSASEMSAFAIGAARAMRSSELEHVLVEALQLESQLATLCEADDAAAAAERALLRANSHIAQLESSHALACNQLAAVSAKNGELLRIVKDSMSERAAISTAILRLQQTLRRHEEFLGGEGAEYAAPNALSALQLCTTRADAMLRVAASLVDELQERATGLASSHLQEKAQWKAKLCALLREFEGLRREVLDREKMLELFVSTDVSVKEVVEEIERREEFSQSTRVSSAHVAR